VPARVIATGPVNRIVLAAPDGHIYTVDPDGGRRTQISPVTGAGFPGGQFTWPVWSPDGGTVLFSSVLEAPTGGANVSLLRAPAAGGEYVILYEDDPLSQGIGNGVPHFAMWSPDGERIALIAGASQELVTLLLDSETGQSLEGVSVGAPVYMAWSPDSRFLLVHLRDTLFLHQRGEGAERGRRSLQLSNPAQNYYAPQFAPRDNRFVFGDEIDGVRHLVMRLSDGITAKDLGAAPGILGFRWSPSGDSVAVGRGEESGLFESLSVVSPQGAPERELLKKRMYGFWWSPDGRKIAVAAASRSYRVSIDWSVIDVATGAETMLGTSLPSPEFEFVLSFFDQYGNASQMWSPDSKSFVVTGTMLKPPPVAQPGGELAPPPRGQPEQVWVLDASGADAPKSIGEGFLAFWSPR
jgi:Tol biopolymer transport system component